MKTNASRRYIKNKNIVKKAVVKTAKTALLDIEKNQKLETKKNNQTTSKKTKENIKKNVISKDVKEVKNNKKTLKTTSKDSNKTKATNDKAKKLDKKSVTKKTDNTNTKIVLTKQDSKKELKVNKKISKKEELKSKEKNDLRTSTKKALNKRIKKALKEEKKKTAELKADLLNEKDTKNKSQKLETKKLSSDKENKKAKKEKSVSKKATSTKTVKKVDIATTEKNTDKNLKTDKKATRVNEKKVEKKKSTKVTTEVEIKPLSKKTDKKDTKKVSKDKVSKKKETRKVVSNEKAETIKETKSKKTKVDAKKLESDLKDISVKEETKKKKSTKNTKTKKEKVDNPVEIQVDLDDAKNLEEQATEDNQNLVLDENESTEDQIIENDFEGFPFFDNLGEKIENGYKNISKYFKDMFISLFSYDEEETIKNEIADEKIVEENDDYTNLEIKDEDISVVEALEDDNQLEKENDLQDDSTTEKNSIEVDKGIVEEADEVVVAQTDEEVDLNDNRTFIDTEIFVYQDIDVSEVIIEIVQELIGQPNEIIEIEVEQIIQEVKDDNVQEVIQEELVQNDNRTFVDTTVYLYQEADVSETIIEIAHELIGKPEEIIELEVKSIIQEVIVDKVQETIDIEVDLNDNRTFIDTEVYVYQDVDVPETMIEIVHELVGQPDVIVELEVETLISEIGDLEVQETISDEVYLEAPVELTVESDVLVKQEDTESSQKEVYIYQETDVSEVIVNIVYELVGKAETIDTEEFAEDTNVTDVNKEVKDNVIDTVRPFNRFIKKHYLNIIIGIILALIVFVAFYKKEPDETIKYKFSEINSIYIENDYSFYLPESWFYSIEDYKFYVKEKNKLVFKMSMSAGDITKEQYDLLISEFNNDYEVQEDIINGKIVNGFAHLNETTKTKENYYFVYFDDISLIINIRNEEYDKGLEIISSIR